MSRFRVSKTSIGCGASVTAILTILSSFNWWPENLRDPAVVSALTGLLTTLGAAFQVCDIRPSGRKRSNGEKDETA